MSFTQEESRILLGFLGRTELKGNEVMAFNKLLQAVERESKIEKKPDTKVVSVGQTGGITAKEVK